jgi:hypothetical protein
MKRANRLNSFCCKGFAVAGKRTKTAFVLKIQVYTIPLSFLGGDASRQICSKFLKNLNGIRIFIYLAFSGNIHR